MSKIIKVVVTTNVRVSDKAEIVRIIDDDGVESEFIRVAGRLASPIVHWMEYLSAARLEEQNKKLFAGTGVPGGMGFEQLNLDFCEEHLKEDEFPAYYFEELKDEK